MITGRILRTVDARLGLAPLARKAMVKVFPDHWSFMLGEIALYSFVVLVLTGVFLGLFFEPSTAETTYRGGYQPLDGARVSAAYASTVALSFDVRAGLLIRQTHHWAALIFVGAIVVHLSRIFFTGAFRKPREINWLIGVTMLSLALLNGFSGYSMPDDLLSGTGLRIIYSVVESTPVAGGWLAALLFGGEFPAAQTAPRLYLTHVLIVPGVLIVLITLHLTILVRQKHSQFPGPGRTEHNVVGSRLWPSYTPRTLALFAWVVAVLGAFGGLVQINPVWLYGPFDPAEVSSPAQPDWYVAWGDGALRLFPPIEFRIAGHLVPAPFLPGVGLGAVTFLFLYAWPFLAAWRSGDRDAHQLLERPRDHPVRLGIGVGVLVFFALLVVAAGNDVIARLLRIPVANVLLTLRILVLTAPWLAGLGGFLWARALTVGGAAGLSDITPGDLRAATSRVRGDLRAATSRVRDDPGAATSRVRRHPRAAPSGREPVPARAASPESGVRPQPAVDGLIEIWTPSDGTWRWRYAGGTESIVLTSNQAFASRDAAAESARRAFPGVRVDQVDPPAGALVVVPEHRPSPQVRLLAAAAWVVLLVTKRRRSR